MIAAFPDLYPDEMLTSGWARYEAWVGHTQRPAVLDELFGRNKYSVAFDLPGSIGHFAASLPPGHSAASVERLIQEHTLLPYYTAFLPAERIVVAYDMMRGLRPIKIHAWVGLSGRQAPTPKYLRYCPCCVADDRERYSETYWHRTHHLAGVEVCPQHEVWLETTETPMWMTRGSTTFVSAEAVVQAVDARPVQAVRVEQNLLRLARGAEWLLEHPELNAEAFRLDERFRLQLASRGLATYNLRRSLRQLLMSVRERLTPELLARVGCDWSPDNYQTCWAARLLRDTRYTHFTLYRLLLVLYFSEDVPSFLQLPVELRAFGDGPWPCLNPGCEHYRQPSIPGCEMDFSHKGLPRGKFACQCGFVYTRVGPDTRPEDRYRIGTALAHGPVWEEALRALWMDPAANIRDMERLMHSSWHHLRLWGTRLGLPFPPPGVRPAPRTATPLDLHEDRRVDVTPYRAAWLEVMEQHPEAGIKILRREFQNLYFWLRNNDREWLTAHLPERKYQPRPLHNDSAQRDRDMATLLEAAFERLQRRQDPPLRISVTALMTEIGRRSTFGIRLQRLPLTRATLQRLAESTDDFAIRRIGYVARKMAMDGIVPRRYVLIQAAGVGRFHHNPRVQATIDMAAAWLQAPDVGVSGDNFIVPFNMTQGAS